MSPQTFTIRGNGSFEFEMLGDLKGTGSRVSVNFSRKLLHELVKISAKCMDVLDGEHPLQQRERSMYSALAAAANRITPAHFSELSMKRAIKSAQQNNRSKKSAAESAKEINSRGRVDLWCQWKNVQFVIELKRTAIGLTQSNDRLGLRKSWNSVTEQATAVKADFTNLCDKGSTIGLLCVCPWSRAPRALKRRDWSERGNDIRADLVNLQPRPSFIAYWKIRSDRWVNNWEKEDGSSFKEVIPFIFLVGLIDIC